MNHPEEFAIASYIEVLIEQVFVISPTVRIEPDLVFVHDKTNNIVTIVEAATSPYRKTLEKKEEQLKYYEQCMSELGYTIEDLIIVYLKHGEIKHCHCLDFILAQIGY